MNIFSLDKLLIKGFLKIKVRTYYLFYMKMLLESERGGTFKMAEEYDMKITFFPTNTSEIHLHVAQLLQNTY